MANAVGVKVGDRETRDIADIFALTEPEYIAIAYCDPEVGKRDYKALPDGEVLAAARARRPRRGLHGIRTFTIRGSRAGCTAFASRRYFCGALTIACSARLTAAPLRDDCGRPVRTDRPRRAFPRSRAAQNFCRKSTGVRESQMTPQQEYAP